MLRIERIRFRQRAIAGGSGDWLFSRIRLIRGICEIRGLGSLAETTPFHPDSIRVIRLLRGSFVTLVASERSAVALGTPSLVSPAPFREDVGAMEPFSQATRNEKLVMGLRWAGVLPAAVLGGFVVRMVVGAIVQVTGLGAGGALGDSNAAYWIRLLLYFGTREAAFVIAGTKMAPRRQATVSIVLAIIGVLVALMTHVVGQHLAGNRVGSVNYTHFLAESAGALGGSAFVLWRSRRSCGSPEL